jgi:hypothetical protein
MHARGRNASSQIAARGKATTQRAFSDYLNNRRRHARARPEAHPCVAAQETWTPGTSLPLGKRCGPPLRTQIYLRHQRFVPNYGTVDPR